MAVTDAQDGYAEGEYGWIDIRAAGFENAGWAAGDDDAVAVLQFGCGRVAGLDVCIHAEFTNSAGDQMSILAPGVEDRDLRG